MEGGLPMLNCLLQHTLRSLCSSSDSSNSSKWVYAVFWRILPRNYPPPKWDYGGGVLDRSKGNKRNWILVWEDGYCDFFECERAGSGYMKGRFGPDVFFKMSHEVYNYGEGLVGKVAGENSHKWVFREALHENDSKFVSSWNGSMEPQPKAWEFQFNSGIQTIAIISVREGIIQLGSLNKIDEDLNLVISIQRKFSYLQSIPGVFAMQRPYLPTQNSNSFKFSGGNEPDFWADEKRNLTGGKRCYGERLDESPCKSINLGWNNPQNTVSGGPFWSIPPLLPSMSCSLGALLSKLPSVIPSHNAIKANDTELDNPSMATNWASKVTGLGQNSGIKMEPCVLTVSDEEKPKTHLHNSSSEDEEGDEPCIWGLEVREDRRDKEEIALIKLN